MLIEIPCRFSPRCYSQAVAIWHIPNGCICWSDPVQALCEQHRITVESTGPVTLICEIAERIEKLAGNG